MQVANKDISVSVQDIDATLVQGKVLSAKIWQALIVCCIVLSAFIISISVIYCFIDISDTFWIGLLLTGIILMGICSLVFLYINIGKKKVSLWLQDVVILKAITQKVDETTIYRYPVMSFRATAIQIRFSYMGKRFVKSSVQKGKISCLPIYNKYVDKEILIAYSPSTDNVMFIKPKSEQRILAELSK